MTGSPPSTWPSCSVAVNNKGLPSSQVSQRAFSVPLGCSATQVKVHCTPSFKGHWGRQRSGRRGRGSGQVSSRVQAAGTAHCPSLVAVKSPLGRPTQTNQCCKGIRQAGPCLG
jgi:hypothetical protein